MQYQISQLSVYPVKSAAGVSLDKMNLGERGPTFDRQWMVVDTKNQFVTQRKHARMCLIETGLTSSGIRLSAPTMPTIEVNVEQSSAQAELITVTVWKDDVDAMDCGDEAAAWFSDYLKFSCRLVTMPEQSRRLIDPDYAKQSQVVGFADGFPLLIVSAASLDSFNAGLTEYGSKLQISMQRFRPNIVISGCEAYAEDSWRKIQIGDIVFSLVKPCSRCIIPAIDPATGAKQMDVIAALNSTRRRQGKTYFGQNALHDRNGLIMLGDSVTVLE